MTSTDRLIPVSQDIQDLLVGQAVRALIKRYGAARVAEVAGCSKSNVHYWARGTWLPSTKQAAALNELLGAASLVSVLQEARKRVCAQCGDVFTRPERTMARYCREGCRREAEYIQARAFRATLIDSRFMEASRKLKRQTKVGKALRMALDGICAMCPEGGVVCGNRECPGHGVTKMACVVSGCVVRHMGRIA